MTSPVVGRERRGLPRLGYRGIKPVQLQSGALIVVAIVTAVSPIGRAAEAPVPDAGALEEVVVTAQRRTERPLDVAASISVITAADIDRLHVTSLEDLAAAAPGLVIYSGVPGQTTIVLRGVPQYGSGSLVATLVDDVAVGSSSPFAFGETFELDLLPYDIERLEILRGPQGTLYGANSMGGVLKYVTRDPSLTATEAQIGAELFDIKGGGSLGSGARGSWSTPLIEGALAMRASLYGQETPGYVENPLRGFIRENTLSQDGGRVALLWQPQTALQVRLQGIYQRIDSGGYPAISAEQLGTPQDPYYRPGHWLGDLTYPHVVPEPFIAELKFVTGSVNWHTAFADLVAVTGYSDKSAAQTMDYTQVNGYAQPLLDPNTTSMLNRQRLYARVHRFSQEIRVVSKSGSRLEWLAGAYYGNERAATEQYSDALDSELNLIPALNPFFAQSYPSTYSEFAAFGTSTYRISDRFDLTGGLRWLTNRQSVDAHVFANELPPPPAGDYIARSDEQRTTYTIAARYRLRPETMAYLQVATGYRPGVANGVFPGYPEIPVQTHSDSTQNYEVGIKSELMARKVSLEAAVFKINWTDMQIGLNTPDGRVGYAFNAGRATSKGLEISANYWPIDALHLGMNAAYTDSFTTEAVPAVNIVAGERLPVPKWTAAATLDCRLGTFHEWISHVDGEWRYIASQYTTFPTFPPVGLLPGYSWVNLELRMTKGRYDVAVFAKNLLDKRAFNTGGPFTANTAGPSAPVPPGFASPSFIGVSIQPRVVGLSVTFGL
jgi:outer membrane receptor protein involved in Fe transport